MLILRFGKTSVGLVALFSVRLLVQYYNSQSPEILRQAYKTFTRGQQDYEPFSLAVNIFFDAVIFRAFTDEQATALALDAFEDAVNAARDLRNTAAESNATAFQISQSTTDTESGETQVAKYQEGIQVVDPRDQQPTEARFTEATLAKGFTTQINEAKQWIKELRLQFPHKAAVLKKQALPKKPKQKNQTYKYYVVPREDQKHPELTGYQLFASEKLAKAVNSSLKL
ncbi:hypothetical protein [Endozoicomonas sp. ALB032]|uniref:hypothetical protein n=1 Tax=Endozoicomonas sp. ALB032 TaxID=3403082 RepID=UPI003BB7CFB8